MKRYLTVVFLCVIAVAGWMYDRDIRHADAKPPIVEAGRDDSRTDCNGNGIEDEIELGPLPGHALAFDGNGDYVDPGTSSALADLTQGDFTIEAWIRTDDPGHAILVGNAGGAQRLYNFVIRGEDEGGVIRLRIVDGETSHTCDGSASINDGNWHHVAAARWINGPGGIRIYVDGEEVGTLWGNFDMTSFTVDKDTLIGRDQQPSPHYFNGAMDEVRVWNVGRFWNEIRADMYRVLDGDEEGLVAYWRFDEGEGLVAHDSAGDSDGELVGSPEWLLDADCNGNDILDECDIYDGTSQDCNGNGNPDECDIADGTSQDCNENGIPDECEVGGTEDCNTNGVPDLCDIFNATSADCNENAIPDECETGGQEDCNGNGTPDLCDIADGASQDCNENRIPDECEPWSTEDCNSNGTPDLCDIIEGTSGDCNGNGVPDECDVSAGTSEDCNGNGVPDECDLSGGAGQDCNGNGVLDECETVVVGTIFVDDDATSGLNDGSSWVDAFVDLEDALAYSQCSGLVYEIRVAGGTYKPGTDQEDSFHLVNGVELRGGYRGLAGGGDPDERDIDAFESVLSGDIGVIGESGDNCRHVVVCENADATTVIEGFTITEGLASGASGGGMLIMQEGSPTIVQCRFVANGASQGGGIRISHSNAAPTILDCTFSGNRASKGGGLSSSSLTGMTIADCKFSNNSAGNGGGMYIVAGSPTLSNCTFSSNNSGDGGGGMYAEDGSPTLTNCTFSGNFAEVYGGGMLAENASPTLTNCVFSGNSTDLYGGGMYQHDGHTTAVNCTIVGNSAGMWAGGCFNWWETDGVTTCKNCIIWGNTAPDSPQASYSDIDSSCVQGGHPGSGNIDADPLFVDADGPDGIYGTADDDVHLLEGSPCINAGDDEAIPEGVTIDFDGEPRVQQCRVDMGVDETPYFEDCNSNGASDACDISSCDGSAWCSDCNENGIPDECDIASGASTDLNGNGVPDECELFGDCDFDGDVDLDDLEAMLGCLFGPDETPSEGCECGDGDADLDVDLADFALFQQQFTGPLP